MHLERNFSITLGFLFSKRSIIAVMLFKDSEKRSKSLRKILEHTKEVPFFVSLSPFLGILKVPTSYFNQTCLSIYRISTWKYYDDSCKNISVSITAVRFVEITNL